MENEDRASHVIGRLRALGVRVHAVDGAIRLSGSRDAMAKIPVELRTSLRLFRDDCIEYLAVDPQPRDMNDSAEAKGALAPHLREFWAKICAGEHDIGFTNNTNRVIEVRGPLRLDLVRQAADDVVRAHPILNYNIENANGDWRVGPGADAGASFQLEDSPDSEGALRERVHKAIWTPLRMDGRLHRFFVVSDRKRRHVFGLVLHHFVADRESVASCANLFWRRYFERLAGLSRPITPELGGVREIIDHRDIHGHPAYIPERTFWSRRRMTSRDALPDDRPNSNGATHRNESAVVARTGLAPRLARQLGITTLSVLLGAHALALARLLGRTRVELLLLDSGRMLVESDLTIGNFNRLVPIAVDVDRERTLADVSEAIHRERLLVRKYADVPFELIRRTLWPDGQSPLLPLINYIKAGPPPTASQRAILPIELAPFDAGNTPSVLCRSQEFEAYYLELHDDGTRVQGALRFSPHLLSDENANALLRYHSEILADTGLASP